MKSEAALHVSVLVVASVAAACLGGATAGTREDREYQEQRRATLERVRAWTGCYSLTVGPWQSATGQVDTGSMFAPRVTLPRQIRLELREHLGYLRMSPAPDRTSGYGNAAWLPLGTDPQRDTLVLIWLTNDARPFSPILWTPTTLTQGRYLGRQVVSTDVIGIERPYRDLAAIRQPCTD